MNMQLGLDGTEVPAASLAVVAAAAAPMSPTQRGVLAHLREHGSIRPIDAGRILFANQGTPWRGRYASADGSEVLRRMAMRGLVHKEARGQWVLGPPGQPVPLRRSEKRRRA